jgi:hypothetical protein
MGGRGHPFTDEDLEKALKLLAEGKTLKKAAEAIGYWRQNLSARFHADPEMEARYEVAVKQGIEANLEVAFEAATQAKNNFEVQKARLIADNAKWDAAKRYAAVYGDRIDSNLTEPLSIFLGIQRKAKAIPDATVVSEQ